MEVYKETEYPYFIKDIYIPLEDLGNEWNWTVGEIYQFDELWEMGVALKDMAVTFNKQESTMVIVAIDRLINGKIKPRKGWNLW